MPALALVVASGDDTRMARRLRVTQAAMASSALVAMAACGDATPSPTAAARADYPAIRAALTINPAQLPPYSTPRLPAQFATNLLETDGSIARNPQFQDPFKR
jgi:hypothetical protein